MRSFLSLLSLGLVGCSSQSAVSLEDVAVNFEDLTEMFDAEAALTEIKGCAFVMMKDQYEGVGVSSPYYLSGSKVAHQPLETIGLIEALYTKSTGEDLGAYEIALKYGEEHSPDETGVLKARVNCAKIIGQLDRMKVTYG